MNIINLPIDVTVAKEIVEKRVVEEEGCLVLLGKKPRNTEEQISTRRVFQFVVLLCIRLRPVPRFDRRMLCLTTQASLAGVWAARLIVLSGKAARYMYKSLGNQNSAS